MTFLSHFWQISYLFLLNLTTFFGIPLSIILHAQCHNLFFSYFLPFLNIYQHFLKKTWSLDAPRLDARGRRTHGTPSARHCLHVQ